MENEEGIVEDKLKMTAYKLRVMLSHVRESFDNCSSDEVQEKHELADVFFL